MRTPGWEDVERAKQASAGQLLFKCARLLNEEAIARVKAQGGPGIVLREAHTRLLPHVAKEGTRLTELARKLGVSKQAVGQLVAELVENGVLAVEPDPQDGRARLVRFTPRGREAIVHGLGVLAAIERELAASVGKARLRELGDTLARLGEALEAMAAARRG